MQQVEADVVVIAAGTAGLAAAIAAAEKGASVIVFEKAATVGGAGNMARGPFAVESSLQKTRKIPITKEEAFKIHMDYTHWLVDARLVSEFINKSASTIDWLADMGVKFIDVQSHNCGLKFTWHIIDGPLVPRGIPGTGVVMMKLMAERAKELGVKVYFRTPAKKLIKEGGQITGVIAEDESGEDIRVKAKAVVVATGGFSDNPAMIKKYIGVKTVGGGMVAGVTGDGIRMAWEVGAAPTKMILHGPGGVQDDDDEEEEVVVKEEKKEEGGGMGALFELLTLAYTFQQPNLKVNLLAERFMDEVITQTTPFGSNPVSMQKKGVVFTIFDEDTKEYYVNEGLDFPPGILIADPLLKIETFDEEFRQAAEMAPESFFTVNSVEELADKTGLDKDKLAQTVAEYNEACDTGRDEIFHKDPKYLRPVRRPPFYVSKTGGRPGGGGLGTLGGIKINYKTEVIDKKFNAIPGLYAAGLDANSIYGDTYIFWLPGNTLGFALNSGRMAGENAAEYAKEK